MVPAVEGEAIGSHGHRLPVGQKSFQQGLAVRPKSRDQGLEGSLSPNRLVSPEKRESETVIDSSSAPPPTRFRQPEHCGGGRRAASPHGPHLETPGGLLTALPPPRTRPTRCCVRMCMRMRADACRCVPGRTCGSDTPSARVCHGWKARTAPGEAQAPVSLLGPARTPTHQVHRWAGFKRRGASRNTQVQRLCPSRQEVVKSSLVRPGGPSTPTRSAPESQGLGSPLDCHSRTLTPSANSNECQAVTGSPCPSLTWLTMDLAGPMF